MTVVTKSKIVGLNMAILKRRIMQQILISEIIQL
jgi:hypothetical protein